MKPFLRSLRLLNAVIWTIACLATLALWARSYWRLDYRIIGRNNSYAVFLSQQGQLQTVVAFAWSPPAASGGWSEESASSELFRTTFALPNTPHPIPPGWTTELSDLRKFGWACYADGFKAVVPHWFVAAICGCLAALPWSKRFGLRALFLALTLVAVVCAIAVRVD